jgi:hypothetical protein
MYFSTDCSVTTTDSAMAASFFPLAISARVSRSRGVSVSSGESSRRDPAALRGRRSVATDVDDLAEMSPAGVRSTAANAVGPHAARTPRSSARYHRARHLRALWASSRPSATTPDRFIPRAQRRLRAEWRPVPGRTVTGANPVRGPSRCRLPFEHRATGACLSGRLMGHSALAKSLDRAERFAMMLFMRP